MTGALHPAQKIIRRGQVSLQRKARIKDVFAFNITKMNLIISDFRRRKKNVRIRSGSTHNATVCDILTKPQEIFTKFKDNFTKN